MILGLYAPTSGTIKIDEKPLTEILGDPRFQKVGSDRLPEPRFFFKSKTDRRGTTLSSPEIHWS